MRRRSYVLLEISHFKIGESLIPSCQVYETCEVVGTHLLYQGLQKVGSDADADADADVHAHADADADADIQKNGQDTHNKPHLHCCGSWFSPQSIPVYS